MINRNRVMEGVGGIGVAIGLSFIIAAMNPPVAGAIAQDGPPPSSAPGRMGTTRSDLSAACMRLEEAMLAHEPQAEALAKINRDFDQAAAGFFDGRDRQALREIDRLALSLLGQPASSPLAQAMCVKVRAFPVVYRIDAAPKASFRATRLYEEEGVSAGRPSMTLEIVSPDGAVVGSQAIATPGIETPVDGEIEFKTPAALSPGLYLLRLVIDGAAVPMGRWAFVAGSLEGVREANAARLDAAEKVHPELSDAAMICAVRNQLLTDHPSQSSAVLPPIDLDVLQRDIASEIAAIEAGTDPYRGRAGDIWRIFQSQGVRLPIRLYVPAGLSAASPAPLVIALHGAGGDENMFMEAYGAGALRRLADERKLIVVSPQVNYFAMNAAHFDALVDDLCSRYPVDRSRIYLLGHSLGAAAAANLARSHADKVAAACCIAGTGSGGDEKTPSPTLMIVGELDGVTPPKGIEEAVKASVKAGEPIELHVIPGQGHALLVPAVLPDAVDWLLKHRLAADPHE